MTDTLPARTDTGRRVDDLIAAMTLEEKAGQLCQYFYFGIGRAMPTDDPRRAGLLRQTAAVEEVLARGGAGSLLFVNTAAETNRLQRLTIDGHRLGIPALFGYDVIHGLRTIFPVPLAMAASWDPDLVERVQATAAREARAVGIHWTFAPMVDIARDPRWGRIVEGAGEDPYLGRRMAAAQVRGFQGDGAVRPDGVLAGPKHLAGYGAALGGRDYDEANLSEYELRNVYLPPFQAALDAGARTLMTAYMDLNGVPATGHEWLLSDVLRDEWGFDGLVVSDAEAVQSLVTHGFATDPADAAERALSAGVDLEMAIADAAYTRLPAAVAAGTVTLAAVDTAVRRVLEAKASLGLFDAPYVDEDDAERVLADPEHRITARVAAERSFVLLKNDAGTLPLREPSSVAVLGPLADSARDILGPWVFAYRLEETVTVLQGIRDRAGTTARVDYAPGLRPAQRLYGSIFDIWPDNVPADPVGFSDDAELTRAVETARAAEVAVVVVGEWQNQVGENASRASLTLPGRQDELVRRVAETGTPVVLVVMSGRPVDLREASTHAAAVLQVWYPGTQGGAAVARTLYGDVTPGGKLPISWPRSVGQIPVVYGRTRSHAPGTQTQRYWDEEHTPLYPFGAGLSYTTFAYGPLVADPWATSAGGTVTVSVDVTNTGDRAGDEVVQLYVGQRSGRASRPVRELKGFQRLTLQPGERRTVTFELRPDDLAYWDPSRRRRHLDPGPRDVWVGGDSAATSHTVFDVTS